jgi:hypothetical protein
MAEITDARRQRHTFVTAAHDFLLSVMPLRYPESLEAMNRFMQIAANTRTQLTDTEAILLDVLTVLNARIRAPYLLDHYLASRRLTPDPVNRFHSHVRQLLLGIAIGNKQIEKSIAILEKRYADSTLTQADVGLQNLWTPA